MIREKNLKKLLPLNVIIFCYLNRAFYYAERLTLIFIDKIKFKFDCYNLRSKVALKFLNNVIFIQLPTSDIFYHLEVPELWIHGFLPLKQYIFRL